ncbi:MAG: hypothetical protein HYU81_01645 [Candidatus Brennerbacteria bacterium]|nr:hypothetical protein [Candidatus Brennerbacteria bacterium]
MREENGVSGNAWKFLRFLVISGFIVWGIMFLSANKKAEKKIDRIVVVLKGENVLTDPIGNPKGARGIYYSGPPEARIHFGDGTSGWIAEWHGKKPGPFRFSGPKDDVVLVDIVY